jgi:hypothetical protein
MKETDTWQRKQNKADSLGKSYALQMYIYLHAAVYINRI